MIRAMLGTVLVAQVMLAGCVGSMARQRGFDSPDPAERLNAIVLAGHLQQRSAIPDLIDSLGSDDPAVRMMAITALARITGTRLGYNPYGRLVDRQAAAESWSRAWRAGRFDSGPSKR